MSGMGAALILRRYPVMIITIFVLAGVVALQALDVAGTGRWVATGYVALFIAWTLVGMLRDVLRGHFGLDILSVMAMVATLAVGEHIASLIIVLMLAGGEALEDFAGRRAKRDLSALLDRSPRIAHVLSQSPGAATGEPRDLPVDQVEIGDVLLVRPSEIVPVDGVLLSEAGTFDESSLTGESLPVSREAGEEVLSGAINGDRAVRMQAIRTSADSQYQQIVALVRAAEGSHAPIVRLADRFAVPFTAVALVLASAAWAFSGDPKRFAEVLVLATPCPLLIAAPVAFLGGLSRAAKAGVIMKGGAVIEQIARVRSIAFDKTGTLTQGRPELVDVQPASGFDADEVLKLAASAEQYSSHALAESIRRAARTRGIALRPATAAREEATNGVVATIDGREVVVGKPAFVASLAPDTVRAEVHAGQAVAYTAVDGQFAGVLVLADQPRPEAAAVVSWLRAHGVGRMIMLTGDVRATAEPVARLVGLDEIHAELLPPEKVRIAEGLRPRPVMMIGDGVNDAPVLAAADIGIAMGAKGATAAGDAADVVILVDSLASVVDAVSIGRRTVSVAITAIWIGIGLSTGLMLVATTGLIPAVFGALIQEGVDLATILYALRAVRGSPAVLPAAPRLRSATTARPTGQRPG